jgi:hypothetical protein
MALRGTQAGGRKGNSIQSTTRKDRLHNLIGKQSKKRQRKNNDDEKQTQRKKNLEAHTTRGTKKLLESGTLTATLSLPLLSRVIHV